MARLAGICPTPHLEPLPDAIAVLDFTVAGQVEVELVQPPSKAKQTKPVRLDRSLEIVDWFTIVAARAAATRQGTPDRTALGW